MPSPLTFVISWFSSVLRSSNTIFSVLTASANWCSSTASTFAPVRSCAADTTKRIASATSTMRTAGVV